ncbi:hypothetical protein DFP73DRAFT_587815 [Morchella snyderi]|nr:hypothetical protein DFP73DRAFT_587815 [Morchella snyderi]
MSEYTSQAQDHTMVAPNQYHPFPEDININPMHGSMGPPSQWSRSNDPQELYPPVTHLALSDLLWYQPDYQDADEEGIAVNPSVAAAIAACNASAAEFTNAAAICSAAAAAIMAAGIPAGNACQSAATAILAAGIPVADTCAATAEACNVAASCFAVFGAAENTTTEVQATKATTRRSRRIKSDKAQPSRPPKSSNTRIKKVQSPKAKTGIHPPKSAYAKPVKSQAKTGTRSRKPAHAAVKKAQVSHVQTGSSSLESTNAIPKTIQSTDTQIRTPRTTAKNNQNPTGKNLKAQRKVVTPGVLEKTLQPVSHSYNLRSIKKGYNLRSTRKDGAPKPAAIKPDKSAIKKNTRK